MLEGDYGEDTALNGWIPRRKEAGCNTSWEPCGPSRRVGGCGGTRRSAVLGSSPDDWLYYLALSELDRIQDKRRESIVKEEEWKTYQEAVEEFKKKVGENNERKKEKQKQLVELKSKLELTSASPFVKRETLEEIFKIDPDNKRTLVGLSFYSAMEEKWTRRFLLRGITWEEREGKTRTGSEWDFSRRCSSINWGGTTRP